MKNLMRLRGYGLCVVLCFCLACHLIFMALAGWCQLRLAHDPFTPEWTMAFAANADIVEDRMVEKSLESLPPDRVVINLPATVTMAIRTNVFNGDNSKGCATCEGIRTHNWLLYHPSHGEYVPWQEATDRWVITNIVRETRVVVRWEDKDLEYQESQILDSTTNHYSKRVTWE